MSITLRYENIEQDEITSEVSNNFDYDFSGVSECTVPTLEELPTDFGVGLIVGPSGSGKSTMLGLFGQEEKPHWADNKAVVSHFSSPDDAQDRLSAVGLNSIPAWFRPYSILSTGEKYRANLARQLRDGAVVDEFTSVVDRSVAKSCSNALSRYIKSSGLKAVVFASCHYDIIEWLEPDWVYDTLTRDFLPRGCLRRPDIKLELIPCRPEAWPIFRDHHYLSGNLNKSAKHWICLWGTDVVGFTSVLAMPSGTLKRAFRGHRTVVLPDYQGLGIGVRISDAIGQIYIENGDRYFSKTTHPRMGEYRNKSSKWKPTSKNMKVRGLSGHNKNMDWLPRNVFSYSHEYIGEQANVNTA
tara:strand:- start:14298 stop:15362 length:1065 start_codon:yes stop_codon:yes gene_type:complete